MMLLFVSCKDIFYTESEPDNLIQTYPALCVLTATTNGSSGRAAFPSLLGTLKYFAVIKAPDGNFLTDNASSPVSTSMVFLENKTSNTSLKFVFVPYSKAGSYTITVYAFLDTSAVPTAGAYNHYKAKAVMEKNLPAHEFSIDLGNIVLSGNTDKDAPKGTVNLPISTGSGIQRIDLSIARHSGSIPIVEGLEVVLTGSPKKIKHTGTGITPGIYTITITAYDAPSGGNQIFLENPVQTITVFSGCETNSWYGLDGNPLPAGAAALAIRPIEPSAANTFFVKGTGGVLPGTGNDDNTGISLAAPLASLNAAIKKCTGSGPYTIYVDGEVRESEPLTQDAIAANVTLKGLSTRAAVKKAAGFTKSLIRIGLGGHLTLDSVVFDGADINSVNYGGLIYNSGTVTLKNGAKLTSGAAQLGGGAVYNAGTLIMESAEILNCTADNGGAVYNKGTFHIGGSALIRLSTGNDENKPGKNDIYSESGKHITVSAVLSPEGGKTGRITPRVKASDNPDYAGNQLLVKADGSFTGLGSCADKFSITTNTHSEWEADYDGMMSAIMLRRGDVTSWLGLKNAVTEADNDGRIIVKGTIKATKDTGNSGEIPINKDLIIQGESETSIGILDANKDTDGKPKHRIFKIEEGKTLKLKNLTLTGGITEGNGGGVYICGGTLDMTRCTLTGNTAQENGGGIYVKNLHGTPSTVTISGGSLTDNKTVQYNGGGIYIDNDCTVTLQNDTDGNGAKLVGNTAGTSGQGGGVCVVGGNARLKMKGSAQITVNNDVFLANDAKITVDGSLTGSDPIGCITPQNYTAGTQVLEGDITSGNPGNYTKFTVTPKDLGAGTMQNAIIDSAGNLRLYARVQYDQLESYLANTALSTELNYIEITDTIPKEDFKGNFPNSGELGRRIKSASSKKVALKLPENLTEPTDMTCCFKGCTNLVSLESIPANIENMLSTFEDCTALSSAPVIPPNVKDMSGCFQGTSLTRAPVIPKQVEFMESCFRDCTSLIQAPVFESPSSVTEIESCFAGCTNLTRVSGIPASVTVMTSSFATCTKLTYVEIPASVTSLYGCFVDCTSLENGPDIPKSVTSMFECFKGCRKLKGVKINRNYIGCEFKSAFEGCDRLEDEGIKVPSTQLSDYKSHAGYMKTTQEKFSGF